MERNVYMTPLDFCLHSNRKGRCCCVGQRRPSLAALLHLLAIRAYVRLAVVVHQAAGRERSDIFFGVFRPGRKFAFTIHQVAMPRCNRKPPAFAVSGFPKVLGDPTPFFHVIDVLSCLTHPSFRIMKRVNSMPLAKHIWCRLRDFARLD